MDGFLHFENVTKSFGAVTALRDVTLSVNKGEVFSLLGPSGCGKTTLLRIAAGFEQPDSGRVYLDGVDITDLPPNRRPVNTVFQNYALFPHLSVRDNVAFGLKAAGIKRAEIEARVTEMLARVQITEDQASRKPPQLSGGQKQRVAIARALINQPRVLLLDEPLAALDLKLRQRMLIELDEIHDQVGITFLNVTHDQGEAMGLSDRIAVMNEGRVEQIGTPGQIYESPVSSFTAAFIGDTNFFDGVVAQKVDGNYSRLRIEGFPDVLCYNDRERSEGDFVYLSVRPERFAISLTPAEEAARRNHVEGVVEDVIYLGSLSRYWVRVGEYRLSVSRQHTRYHLDEKPIQWGDKVWLSWSADDGFMLERYRPADEELLSLPPEEAG
ncbi:MAG: ABC transporter ATP-binding protein [Kiritimatiellia bacterium]